MFHSSRLLEEIRRMLIFLPSACLMDDKVYYLLSIAFKFGCACVGDVVYDLIVVVDAGDLGLTFSEDDGL